MVNEEKVKIMNRLAMYEHGEGRKYLPVSRFYRSDYIGLALIKNFFLVTIGYVLGLAGVAAYFSEYLMDNVNKINLVAVGSLYCSRLSDHTYCVFNTDLHPVFCEIFQGEKKCQGILSGSYKTGKNLRAGGKRNPVRRNAGGHRK